MDVDAQKRAAAARALEFRAAWHAARARHRLDRQAFRRFARRARARRASTSSPCRRRKRPARRPQRLGIALTTLDETPELDLTVDGADEIAPDLTLIKGGGGALLREKIVAAASARMIVIADESKWVSVLGRFPLPIEIAPFGAAATQRAVDAAIAAAGCSGPAMLAQSKGRQSVRDRRWALDFGCPFAAHRRSARAWRRGFARCPGVMEHGLFIGIAQTAILAGSDGVRLVERRPDLKRMRRSAIGTSRMSDYDVDLFVIGGGSGGVRAARIAAQHGARVMVAEEYRVGGTCVIRGCVPKKLLVYASRFRAEFEDAAGYGWTRAAMRRSIGRR